MLLGVILFIALSTLVIGFVVFVQNTQERINRWVFAYSIAVTAWISTNYFSNSIQLSHDSLVLLNKLVLFFGFTVSLTLNIVLNTLTPRYKHSRWRRAIFYACIVAGLFSLTPLVVASVMPQDGLVAIEFGVLAPIYFLSLVYFVLRSFWVVGVAIKRTAGIQRARLQVISIGVYGAYTVMLLTNVLLPFVMSTFSASVLAPIVFIVVVATLAYAILRQRMFSIHASLMRTIGHTLSFLILAGSMAFLIWSAKLINVDGLHIYSQTTFVFLVVVSAFMFQPLRLAIDRLLTRIFAKRMYDSRDVIDHISDVLISYVTEKDIILHTVNVLQKYMHSQKVTYITSKKIVDCVGTSSITTDYQKQIINMKQKLYVRKDIRNELLDDVMSEHQHEVILCFIHQKVHIGSLVLGQKRNGSAYTSQDIELMQVILKNLTLALVNAKNYQEIIAFSDKLKDEVKKATSELVRANDELKAISTAKDEFVSMATHQIRPQLTAVRGFAEMLSQEKNLNKEQRKMLGWTLTGVERSIRIIADMLNLSRFSSGKFTLEKKRVNLAQLVEEEISALNSLLRTSGVTVENCMSTKAAIISADPIKLKEVIANICHNAIQYSGEKKKIEIHLERKKDHYVFSVRDYGIGVSEEQVESLFSKYFRTSEAKEARPAGTGIGLYLAKVVIEKHSGSVFYAVPEDGHGGSIFGFNIPK